MNRRQFLPLMATPLASKIPTPKKEPGLMQSGFPEYKHINLFSPYGNHTYFLNGIGLRKGSTITLKFSEVNQ